MFGNSVKFWRKKLNISQEEPAERASLHLTYISDLERGARNLSFESIINLASALDVSISELFPQELQKGKTAAFRKPAGELPRGTKS